MDYSTTDVGKLFIDLKNDCLNKMAEFVSGLTEEEINNKIIATIREYNKIWNTIAAKNTYLKKDGFKEILKKWLIKSDFHDSLKSALKYL